MTPHRKAEPGRGQDELGRSPPRPRRERPNGFGTSTVPGVWQPGWSGAPRNRQVRMPRPNLARALLFGLIPLGILAGGIYLVMRLFGW